MLERESESKRGINCEHHNRDNSRHERDSKDDSKDRDTTHDSKRPKHNSFDRANLPKHQDNNDKDNNLSNRDTRSRSGGINTQRNY